MFDVDVPRFPAYVDDEYRHCSRLQLPAFCGMQIRNGPYGAISEVGPSAGETQAVSDKTMDLDTFRTAVNWVIEHDSVIRPLVFAALVDQYWELRDEVIDNLDDEDLDSVVPEIHSPEDLALLCGLVALHIGGVNSAGEPLFGIELGCNWEEEHGAGVRLEGLKVLDSGHATVAFRFSRNKA